SQVGPFGMGWSWTDVGWLQSLSVAPDGTVTVTTANGVRRRFQPDSRGGYFAQLGDPGTLTSGPGGTFILREGDGQTTAFGADGKLVFFEDTKGNKVTVGYTGDLLTSLTSAGGQSLSFAYNSGGRITTVTDSSGRVTGYTYDASNLFLTSV